MAMGVNNCRRHLTPMALCFGPRMLLLGGACVATAITGLLLIRLPYEIFGLADGFLKLGFGVWLFSTQPPGAVANPPGESSREVGSTPKPA